MATPSPKFRAHRSGKDEIKVQAVAHRHQPLILVGLYLELPHYALQFSCEFCKI